MPKPIVFFIAIVGFLLLVGIYRRRQNLAHNLRHLLRSIGFGMLATVGASYVPDTVEYAIPIGTVVVLLLYSIRPRRSRHIPSEIRRRVVAAHVLRTGKKFDASKLELDHEVPFSDGGSHTIDNLVVKEKKKNRSKGAKSPTWDIFGRR